MVNSLFKELSYEDVVWLIPMSTSRNEMALFEALTGWLRYSVGNRQKYLSSTMSLIKFRKVTNTHITSRNVLNTLMFRWRPVNCSKCRIMSLSWQIQKWRRKSSLLQGVGRIQKKRQRAPHLSVLVVRARMACRVHCSIIKIFNNGKHWPGKRPFRPLMNTLLTSILY